MTLRWDDHLARWRWVQGEHVTLIGPTGCGKTTLARAILPLRDYVLVLACKPRDPVLDQLRREGYRVVRRWDDVVPRIGGDRVILWPRGRDAESTEVEQYRQFAAALADLYEVGGWTLYLDEVTYVTDYLGLDRPVRRLWRQGRSIPVSVVAAAQAPVWAPGETWDQVMHLYLWRHADRRRRMRMAEIAGADRDEVDRSLRGLRDHEVLYVDGRSGRSWTTIAPR